MSTMLQEVPSISPDKIVAEIVRSGGDWKLAAEVLEITEEELLTQVNSVPFESLQNAIKVAMTIQAFRTWTETRRVVSTNLSEMSPNMAAKFLVDIMDRLRDLVSTTAQVQNQNNFQFNLNNGNPRDKLTERVISLSES